MSNSSSLHPENGQKTLAFIILSHFDTHQRQAHDDNPSKKRRSAREPRNSATDIGVKNDVVYRCALIRKDVTSFLKKSEFMSEDSISNDPDTVNTNEISSICDKMERLSVLDDARKEVTKAIIQCVDSAFALAAEGGNSRRKEPWGKSRDRIFELAAAFSCEVGQGYATEALVCRAVQCSKAESDSLRAKGCQLLGLCVKHLVGCDTATSTSPKSLTGLKRDLFSTTISEDSPMHSSLEISATTPGKELSCYQWKINNAIRVEDALIPRFNDKSQQVRQSAIQASGFFFPSSKRFVGDGGAHKFEKISESILCSMAHDTSHTNRMAAIRSTNITDRSLPCILSRIRDVKDKVRVEAIDILHEKVDVKTLTEEQISDIVRYGLTERCKVTHLATLKMVCCGWMKRLKFQPTLLLRLLDIPVNEKVSEDMARALILVASSDKDDDNILETLSKSEVLAFKENVLEILEILPRNDHDDVKLLDPVSALWLRVRCSIVKKSKNLNASAKADLLGRMIPDITSLCKVLIHHLSRYFDSVASEKMNNSHDDEDDLDEDEDVTKLLDGECFVCLQLLQLARFADLDEEGSRRHFLTKLNGILCSSKTSDMPQDLIEACIRMMAFFHRTESNFISCISDMVTELNPIDPMEKMNEENDPLLSCQLRVMVILSVVLEHVTQKVTYNATLNDFVCHILSAVTSSNPFIREIGVSCLGKFALLSEERIIIQEFKPTLMKITTDKKEKIEIRAQAALALCDLSLLYDSVLNSPANEFDSNGDIIEGSEPFVAVVSNLFDHSVNGLVIIATEIFVKLFFMKKLVDSNVAAKILFLFFTFDFSLLRAEEDRVDEIRNVGSPVRLQQILSLFFPAYSMKGEECRETLLGAVLPLISLINDKIKDESIKKTTAASYVGKMIDYICTLVEAGEQQASTGSDSRNQGVEKDRRKNVAKSCKVKAVFAVSQFLIDSSCNICVSYRRALFRFLGTISIDPAHYNLFEHSDLKDQLKKLEVFKEDKTCIQHLNKLNDKLEVIYLSAALEQTKLGNTDIVNTGKKIEDASNNSEEVDGSTKALDLLSTEEDENNSSENHNSEVAMVECKGNQDKEKDRCDKENEIMQRPSRDKENFILSVTRKEEEEMKEKRSPRLRVHNM